MKKTTHISLTEAKQRLGELVKRTSYGGERFVLEFRGQPQAMIVKYVKDGDDMRDAAPALLEKMIALRNRIKARTGIQPNSADEIRRLREERDDQLSGLR